MKLTFPSEMKPFVEEVLNGEYDIGFNMPNPVIFDIGANVGSFAIWAHNRWPGCKIYCYEPSPTVFEYLKKNLSGFKNIKLHNEAVGNPKHKKLYKGKYNCGEASFFQLGGQSEKYETVKTISPEKLPKRCDILKIDTEGCEVEILEGLKPRIYQVVLLEYHREADRRKIDQILSDYVLVGSKAVWANRGIVKYINRQYFINP
jgi:FkbM family methyltransferase